MAKKLGVRNLGAAEVQGQSDAQITDLVTKGKNKMPAFDGKLTKEQIGYLVAYIRELGKKHPGISFETKVKIRSRTAKDVKTRPSDA